MVLDHTFLDMMPQTITWEAFSAYSTDGYAVRTFSTGKTIACRIQQRKALSRDAQGREVTSDCQVFCPPYTTDSTTAIVIGVSDRITLPSGFLVSGSSAPPIINVKRHQDEAEDHHFTVFL